MIVIRYRGALIEPVGDKFVALGRTYDSAALARAAIDEIYKTLNRYKK